jgi:hypothetical protein
MNSEIIQSVAYDNYDDFQHVNFIFSHKIISLFLGLLLQLVILFIFSFDVTCYFNLI